MASKGRKYLVTINNPTDKGFNHDYVKCVMQKWDVDYWCMCDEIGGKTQTYHTHLYFYRENPIWWSTVFKAFKEAGDIQTCNGTSESNRNYIRKEGKYEGSEKESTNLKDTFEEFGVMPVEQPGKRTDLDKLYEMIKDGMSNYEIIEYHPQYMMQIEKIERCRQIVKENIYKNKFRKLEVVYIYGKAGIGKTSYVMHLDGEFENVYRVNNYNNPFDNYKGQDILFFDEFYSSSIKISDMLNYLDGYPIYLPCRYADKIACYTKVYIASNIDLSQQYENIQFAYPETWRALLRRITKIVEYKEFTVEEKNIEKYKNISMFDDKGTLLENWEEFINK